MATEPKPGRVVKQRYRSHSVAEVPNLYISRIEFQKAFVGSLWDEIFGLDVGHCAKPPT